MNFELNYLNLNNLVELFYSNNMNDLAELQESLNSNSPEILAKCPSIIARAIINLKSDTITQQIIPAIKSLLSSNFDEVSDTMLQALPYICQIIQKLMNSDACTYICQNILPLFFVLPNEGDEETISIIADAITAIVEPLVSANFIAQFAPFLLSLASSDKKLLRAISALTLEYCAEIIDINPEFDKISTIIIEFATDSSPSIRSHVPCIVTEFISTVNDSSSKSQLAAQMFLLAHDKSPAVRKSVIEYLYDFSKKVDVDTKILTVEPVLTLLLDDQTLQIRMLALARFAPILNTIGSDASEELIKKYCHCLLSEEENVAYSVAFAFSAVALAVGPARFNKEIYPSFVNALQSYDLRVRRTISFSLSTYAQLFTPSDLCITASTLLKDLPFVSLGVISNLSKILPYVDDRQSLLFCLLNPSSKYSEWRMRLKISEQLRKCKEFFDREILLKSALELVEDDVAVVRKDSVKSIAELFDESDINKLKKMAKSENHWTRLSAAEICGLVKLDDYTDIKKILMNLRNDKVFAVKSEAQKNLDNLSFL